MQLFVKTIVLHNRMLLHLSLITPDDWAACMPSFAQVAQIENVAEIGKNGLFFMEGRA